MRKEPGVYEAGIPIWRVVETFMGSGKIVPNMIGRPPYLKFVEFLDSFANDNKYSPFVPGHNGYQPVCRDPLFREPKKKKRGPPAKTGRGTDKNAKSLWYVIDITRHTYLRIL